MIMTNQNNSLQKNPNREYQAMELYVDVFEILSV